MLKHFSATALSSFAVSGLLAAATMLLVTASAHAQEDERERPQRGRLMLALDFDYASAIKHGEIDRGAGGALRIGTQRNLFLVTLIPELSLDYHNFDAHTVDRATIATGKLGGRIRFLKIVEPGIFAHVGIGHVGGPAILSHTGVAFDAGVTLDLTIIPLIDIGLQAAWNRVFGGYGSRTTYGTAGAHVALVL